MNSAKNLVIYSPLLRVIFILDWQDIHYDLAAKQLNVGRTDVNPEKVAEILRFETAEQMLGQSE